jgi:hypothetical protein
MKSPSPWFSTEWLPGTLLLAFAAAAGIGVGLLLGVRSWPLHVGLVVAVLLAMGALDALRARRSGPPSPRLPRRLRIIQGGKAYDLEGEDSTKDQRYLM